MTDARVAAGRTTAGIHAAASGDPPAGIVSLILERARATPAVAALVPAGAPELAMSFGALAERVAAFGAGLRAAGIRPGSRVLLLARPDAELYAFALATLARGMTLVLLDGRPSCTRFATALADAAPDVVVAPAAVLSAWPLIPALRRARRIAVGGVTPPGTLSLARLGRPIGNPRAFRPLRLASFSPAIVSFTSGSTDGGRSKAVVRTHGVLLAQHRALSAAFPVEAGEVNLPGFPAATLHNLCCGATTVLPSGDLRAMADADATTVLALLERCGVTSVSGAPAFMSQLAAAALEHRRPVRTLRRVFVGGGPVGRALCGTLRAAFPDATAHVIYGGTEAEPIATCTLDEVAREAQGEGFLVGRPVPGLELLIVDGEGQRALTGEVAVRGAHVAAHGAWHRTGDVARLDEQGRLWLLGRAGDAVQHRGRELHPYVVEAAALAIRGVRVAALVAHRRAPGGELVVEAQERLVPDHARADVRDALECLGLGTLPVRLAWRIPTDARHASKVLRSVLVRRLERWR